MDVVSPDSIYFLTREVVISFLSLAFAQSGSSESGTGPGNAILISV